MGKKLKIEKGKRKEKWNILNCTDEIIDKNIIRGPFIEMFGNGEITIDGVGGVIEYKDTYIKLKLHSGSILICGSGFDIAYFENNLITVKGKVSSLEFCIGDLNA